MGGLSLFSVAIMVTYLDANPIWYRVHPATFALLWVFVAIEEFRFRKKNKGQKLPTPEECFGRIVERMIKEKEGNK